MAGCGMINLILLQILLAFSSVAVNCYIFISGYFLINTDFRWRKIVKIWCQVAFYCCIIVSIVLFFDSNKAPSLLKAFLQSFPVLSKQYYFVSNYLALLALAPYLAKMVSSINKDEFQKLLGVGLLLNLVIYRFTCGYDFPYGSSFGGAYSLMWFLYLFLVGGYVRKYGVKTWLERFSGTLFITICCLIGCFSFYKTYQLGNPILSIKYLNYNGVVFFASLCLFIFFKRCRCNSICWDYIAKLAPYSFGVYILHDNFYLRNFLWKQFFDISNHINLLYLLVIPVIVYIWGSTIEMLRMYIFRKMKNINDEKQKCR